MHEHPDNVHCCSRQGSFSLGINSALLRGTKVMASLSCVVPVYNGKNGKIYKFFSDNNCDNQERECI